MSIVRLSWPKWKRIGRSRSDGSIGDKRARTTSGEFDRTEKELFALRNARVKRQDQVRTRARPRPLAYGSRPRLSARRGFLMAGGGTGGSRHTPSQSPASFASEVTRFLRRAPNEDGRTASYQATASRPQINIRRTQTGRLRARLSTLALLPLSLWAGSHLRPRGLAVFAWEDRSTTYGDGRAAPPPPR